MRALLVALSRAVFFLMIFIGIIVWFVWPKPPSFTKDDIEKTRADIRTQFEKQKGIRVLDVVMLKESDRKLVGFAKLESDDLKEYAKVIGSGGDGTISKTCTATMGEDGQWVWRCG